MFGNNLFFATWDGRLIALDIKTGKRKWSTRTFHIDEPLYITGAPKAFRGKVLIGNGGTENGPSRGYVSAYDAETGALAWRFFIVPGDPKEGFENAAMEMAAKTWTGEWWKHGGIKKSGVRRAGTICFYAPFWLWMPIQVNINGTTRRPRVKLGILIPIWILCLPI